MLTTNPECSKCHGDGWVCEAHAERAWLDGQGCCGQPGVPCTCNPAGMMPPGFIQCVECLDPPIRPQQQPGEPLCRRQ
jgi:hypothetical protein